MRDIGLLRPETFMAYCAQNCQQSTLKTVCTFVIPGFPQQNITKRLKKQAGYCVLFTLPLR